MTKIWFKPEEASAYTGYARKTLDNWRSEGRGPAYSKVGAAVRYHVADLDKFLMDARVVTDGR